MYRITINGVPAHKIEANYLPELLEYLNSVGDKVMGIRDFDPRPLPVEQGAPEEPPTEV